jgi:dephospho-CoA kinase
VHDSDAEVHRLLGPGGGAVAAVAEAFPSARKGDRIDRPALGHLVFNDAPALKRLESILHPRVRAAQARFVAANRRRRAPVVVLDIPLLFETASDGRCDGVIVVTAPPCLQRARVLRRPGMTEARLATILAQQMPDAEKRRRARWVVPTGLGQAVTLRRLKRILWEVRRT